MIAHYHSTVMRHYDSTVMRDDNWISLYDLDTGRPVWNVRTGSEWLAYPLAPAISPDGRFALVQVAYGSGGPQLALVSMRDGETIQRLPIFPMRGPADVGYANGGRTIWISHRFSQEILFYELQP